MLIEQMLYFLRNNTSEAQFKSYKDLLPFLHTLNPTGFEFSLNQFVAFNDDRVVIDNVAQFNSSLLELLMEEIENFGLYISDSQPVNDKVDFFGQLLQALYGIDQYEDLLAIQFALDAGHDPKETLGEILVLINGELSVERIMEMTADVSPALLGRIREVLNDLSYNFDRVDAAVSPEDVERVKIALAFYGVEGAKRYFVEVGNINDPLESYLDYFFSLPNHRNPEILAKLCLFSAFAAGIPTEQIKVKLSEVVPYYFTDSAELIKITRQIAKLPLPGVDHA